MAQNVIEKLEEEEQGEDGLFTTVSLKGIWNEEDLAHGQPVIVTVRWIMIVTALFLAVWNVESMSDLRLQVIAILLLAVTNFYLQAQLLMKKALSKHIVYAASAVDILMISLLVMFQGGYFSSIFVFYLPAIAAFAVAFPRGLTALYTTIVVFLYGIICLANGDSASDVVLARLMMIAAVAFCGSLYLQIEHKRRLEGERFDESYMQTIDSQVEAA